MEGQKWIPTTQMVQNDSMGIKLGVWVGNWTIGGWQWVLGHTQRGSRGVGVSRWATRHAYIGATSGH